MTTNETFFFRDKIPFDHLREAIIPALVQARAARRALRIWCAASSTGQEPYSIAMCLKEAGPLLSGWRTEIVATDLSQAVLEKSKAGIFSQFEVQRGLADPVAGEIFHPERRTLADQCRDPRHGAASSAQSAAGLLPSRRVRHHLLPQRADLFRPEYQGQYLRAAVADAGARRRAGAGRGRIRGRHHQHLQALSGAPRTLSSEHRAGDTGGGRRPWCRRPCGPSPRRAESRSSPRLPTCRATRSRAAGSATCCR